MKSHRISQGLGFVCALSTLNLSAFAEEPTIEIQEEAARLEETLVMGYKRTGDYTVITEDAEKLIDTAGAFGDPLAAIFALPGVLYSDGQEPAVRGSSPYDNTFVVDFLPASYIFHDFGVSIFSEFVLRDFQMYSAGFGPEYSGATGAVFDVSLRQPENKPLSVVLDLSMLRSGVFMEGGITDNSAFYISYRKSMLHHFIDNEEASDDGININEFPKDEDYQAKYSWQINENHRLSFSANGAADNAAAELTEEADFVASNPDYAGDAEIDDSYDGQSVLYEYNSDSGTVLKLGYGRLDDHNNLSWGDGYHANIHSQRDTFKDYLSLPLSNQFYLNMGSEYAKIDWSYDFDTVLFVCTEFDPDCDLKRSGQRIQTQSVMEAEEIMHHISGIWLPRDNISIELGGQYQYNDYTKETFYHPRFAADWEFIENTRLTAKAGRYSRFPDIETILPETGNPELKSPLSDHFTLGLEQEFYDGWSLVTEFYYKTFSNLPLALDQDSGDADQRYSNGTEGKAQGIDIMINKNKTGKWWGWWSLSYGKSERTNLLTGETKDYYLDTPIVANWVMNYQFTPRFNAGWRWSMRSGVAYTPITGVQQNPWFEDSVLPVYGEPFADRLPMYNRLDIRFQWDITTFGKESEIIVDILNALNYDNIGSRSLDYDKVKNPGDEVVTVDDTGMGIQGAITYRITF